MSFFDRFRRKKDKERLEEMGDRKKNVTEKKPVVKEKSSAVLKKTSGAASRVVLHPIQSEKATKLLEQNQYVFAVTVEADKRTIRSAIRELYGVDPVSISVQNRKGKFVRYGRTTGRTTDARKAIVSLKSGESISLTESK